MRRSRLGSELVALLSALALGGCVELLNLDRFDVSGEDGTDASVRPDGGGERDGGGGDDPDGGGDHDGGGDRDDGGDRDGSVDRDGGGEPDSGQDACVPVTYYLDRDGDGYGDPATAMESCTPIEGRVDNGDDCNDDDASIRPGATETCDDIDQDCDGTIDEGLMQPLGEPVILQSRFSYGFLPYGGAEVVATQQGYTVVLRGSGAIRALHFEHDGTEHSETFVAGKFSDGSGPDVYWPVATRFTLDGLDQIVLAWREPESVKATLCNPGSGCVASRNIFVGSTADFLDMELEQLGRRVIARLTKEDGSTSIVSFDPQTTASSALPLPHPSDPTLEVRVMGLATVDGPEPYSLIGRIITPAPGGSTQDIVGEAQLLRIRGKESLSFDEAQDILPWNFSERCAPLGLQRCFPQGVVPSGAATPERPWLGLLEVLLAGEFDDEGQVVSTEAAGCVFRIEDQLDGPLGAGPCTSFQPTLPFIDPTYPLPLPLTRFPVAVRGPVATIAQRAGATLALREVPLASMADGSTNFAVSLPPWSISMREARGAGIGSKWVPLLTAPDAGYWDLFVQRIGCEP